MQSDSLLDHEFLEPSELLNQRYVVFNIPKIYVSTDYYNGTDQSINNLRAIEYVELLEFVQEYKDILTCNTRDCSWMVYFLFTNMQSILNNSNNRTLTDEETFIFSVLKDISDWIVAYDKYEHEFVSINCNTHLTFDVIRKYTVNEETQILLSAEEAPWFCDRLQKHVHFYSQLLPDEILLARKANDDTELNRIHYMLKIYENILLFRPDFTLDSVIRYLAVAAFMLCLCGKSKNIIGFSLNDLIPHYLCYIFDVAIRTRLITAWQKDPRCKELLKDMHVNYDANLISSCILIQDPIDRIKNILREIRAMIAQDPKADAITTEMVRILSIDDYIVFLNKCAIEIDDKMYYEFNAQSFEHLLLSTTIENVKILMMKRAEREENERQKKLNAK